MGKILGDTWIHQTKRQYVLHLTPMLPQNCSTIVTTLWVEPYVYGFSQLRSLRCFSKSKASIRIYFEKLIKEASSSYENRSY